MKEIAYLTTEGNFVYFWKIEVNEREKRYNT